MPYHLAIAQCVRNSYNEGYYTGKKNKLQENFQKNFAAKISFYFFKFRFDPNIKLTETLPLCPAGSGTKASASEHVRQGFVLKEGIGAVEVKYVCYTFR